MLRKTAHYPPLAAGFAVMAFGDEMIGVGVARMPGVKVSIVTGVDVPRLMLRSPKALNATAVSPVSG